MRKGYEPGFQGIEIYLVPLKPSLVSGLLKRPKEFDILGKTKKGMNEI